MNEAFELFLDNFRGVKEIAETQTVYQCEGVTFAVNGAKSVSLGGKNVTANATIGDKQATLSAAALKGLSGKQEVIIRTAEGNYLYTVNVIGDKLSFEDGRNRPRDILCRRHSDKRCGRFPDGRGKKPAHESRYKQRLSQS